jgi:hypothetical protein
MDTQSSLSYITPCIEKLDINGNPRMLEIRWWINTVDEGLPRKEISRNMSILNLQITLNFTEKYLVITITAIEWMLR